MNTTSVFIIAPMLALTAAAMIAANGNGRESVADRSIPEHIQAKLARGIKSTRYDKPAEAMAFFVEQRLPEGSTRLDPKLYEKARAELAGRPLFSLAKSTILDESSPSELAELSEWQQLGPGNIGGRTRVLRFHPDNPDIMYAAGVAGGVWRSADAGQSWTPLSDLVENLAVVSMAIDHANPDRIWAGTGEGMFSNVMARGAGIFVSNDAGMSWSQLTATDNDDFHYVNDLVQSANDPDTLYAATRTGILRSLDAGATWSKVADAAADGLNVYGGCFDLAIRADIGDQDAVMATCGTYGYDATTSKLTSSVVLRNLDAGKAGTWDVVLSPGVAGAGGRGMIAIAPSDPSVMYALFAAGAGAPTIYNALLGVWYSDDGGGTWQPRVQNTGSNDNNNLLLTNPIIARLEECYGEPPGSNAFYNQGWYDLVISVDPVNPDRVWVGGIDLWRSDNQGMDWGVASYWWFWPDSANFAHADQHGLFFHPDYDGITNKQLFVTNDGGIFRTDDATAATGANASNSMENSICASENLPEIAWTNLNNGYSITQFYHGTVYPDATTYMGGTQDNGTLRGDDAEGPNAWHEVYGGDGGHTAVDPRNPQVIYMETTGISILKSIDGGQSLVGATNGINDSGLFINPFTMDTRYPDRLWTSGSRMWRTDDGASSWVAAGIPLPETAPFGVGHLHTAHAIAPGVSDLVLVGTNYGAIFRNPAASIADADTIWQANTSGDNGRLRSGRVGMIAFDPTQNGSNPDERIAIAVFSAFNSATTFGGGLNAPHVMKTTDGGITWASIDGQPDASIPNIPVHSVAIDPSTRNAQRIFVGTDIGVFVTTDGGQTWYRENAGSANTIVEWLSAQRNPTTNDYELVAFTHGRSVYKTTFEPGDHIFEHAFD
jgi:photosystem II stability/assembly factor-like uncharacterized protein